MIKILAFLSPLFLFSCNIRSSADRFSADLNDKNMYRLRVSPPSNAHYYFNIENESDITVEAESKEIENINKSEVGLSYSMQKDSSGNLWLTMKYDKIHLYSKSGDKETEIDAANASETVNPMERMLGLLKAAEIKATITPHGEVSNIIGYKELGEKVIGEFDANDEYGKKMARAQWEQMVGQGLIKKNIDQLFKMFPDSAIRVGDKWKIQSEKEGELGLEAQTSYQLKAINNDIALIHSEGKLESSGTQTNLAGLQAMADLKGTQDGEYKIETKTGMLLQSQQKADIEGVVQTMGRQLPIRVKVSVKMKRKTD